MYPKRVGPPRMEHSRHMRLQYLLARPRYMTGKYDFMEVLTADPGLGIEFIERFQLTRLAIAILLPVFCSILLAVIYSVFMHDPATAFTIAGEVVIATVAAVLNDGLV